jgi:hypothetical protein
MQGKVFMSPQVTQNSIFKGLTPQWCGMYDPSLSYVKDCIVGYAGSSFISITTVPVGSSPPSGCWELVASKGADGDITNELMAAATLAETSAETATSKALEASTSASNALGSKNSADLSATNASTSASSALSYKNSAATSATNAASSANTASMLLAGTKNVKDFGAKGDWNYVTGTDDAPAFNSALAALGGAGTIIVPPGNYLINSPVVFTDKGQRIVGINNNTVTFFVGGTVGIQFELNVMECQLEQVAIDGPTANHGLFTAIQMLGTQACSINDVDIFNSGTALELNGGCYFNSAKNLYVGYAKNYGINMSVDGGGLAPNNNTIQFKNIFANLPILTPSYGIYCTGSVNNFFGGEIANFHEAIHIADNGLVSALNNRFVGIYEELNHIGANLQNTKGTNYFDMHMPDPVIGTGKMTTSAAGFNTYQNTTIPKKANLMGMTCLYTFQEGSGLSISDKSGNGRTGTVSGNVTWVNTGIYGYAAEFLSNGGQTQYLSIPSTAIAWTSPFTVIIGIKNLLFGVGGDYMPLTVSGPGGRYFKIALGYDSQAYCQVISYDGSTVLSGTIPCLNTGSNSFIAFSYDPVNGFSNPLCPTMTPLEQPQETLHAASMASVSSIKLHSAKVTNDFQADYSLLAIWQRALPQTEVTEFINTFSPVTLQDTKSSLVTLTTGATVALDFSQGSVFKLTPDQALTINGSNGVIGQRASIVITTSGTTAFVITLGTLFKSTGTLSTGVLNNKRFVLSFVYDGTNWCEMSRTAAMYVKGVANAPLTLI